MTTINNQTFHKVEDIKICKIDKEKSSMGKTYFVMDIILTQENTKTRLTLFADSKKALQIAK